MTSTPLQASPANRDQPRDESRISLVREWHVKQWAQGTVVVLIGVFFAYRMFASGVVDTDVIVKFLFNATIIEGVYNTVVLAVLVQAIATVLGLLLAMMRRSKNPVVSRAAWLYVWFFRGVPVIIQLFFWFSAMPVIFRTYSISIPFTDVIFWQARSIDVITPFVAAMLGLGLYGAAYMAEILRGGIEAVPPGQIEAARTLGLGYRKTMQFVVVPQAVRLIIPTTASEFIRTLKNTSLAAVVTYNEVLHAAQDIYNTNLQIAELLFVASIWYLLLVSVTSFAQDHLERKFR